jgi:hypothetical protein
MIARLSGDLIWQQEWPLPSKGEGSVAGRTLRILQGLQSPAPLPVREFRVMFSNTPEGVADAGVDDEEGRHRGSARRGGRPCGFCALHYPMACRTRPHCSNFHVVCIQNGGCTPRPCRDPRRRPTRGTRLPNLSVATPPPPRPREPRTFQAIGARTHVSA